MSENLLSREAYDNYPPVRWGRMGLLAGLFFGLTMWIAFTLIEVSGFGAMHPISITWYPIIGTAVTCGIAGVLAGSTWSLYLRRLVGKSTDRIYERDPNLAPAPDDDAEFTYRIPAGYHPSTRMNVGGSLYIGWSGIAFVPHKRNLPAYRNRVDFMPAKAIELSLVPHEVNPVSRFLNDPLPPLLEISTGMITGRFSMPRSGEVLGLIKAILERGGSPHTNPSLK
jgi:hypothetical protein